MAAKSQSERNAVESTHESPATEPREVYTNRLKECIIKLQRAVENRDDREAIRVLRRLQVLRKSCCPSVLREVYLAVVSPPANREAAEDFFAHVSALGVWSEDAANRTAGMGDASATTNTEVEEETQGDMGEEPGEGTVDLLLQRISTDEKQAEAVPHIQLWFSILATFLAVDTYVKALQEECTADLARLLELGCAVALECSKFVKLTRRKPIDTLDAKAYFAMARMFTLAGRGGELRGFLLDEFRTAALERKLLCQATLINQLLQSYIDSAEYDMAIKFTLKTTFPEDVRSTAQVVRCLYNLGRIQAVRLEYSDAHEKLMTAVRKLPPNDTFAKGFKLRAYKHAIIVELLMGDVPDIAVFRDDSLRHRLQAYEGIVQAVRTGDLNAFATVLSRYSSEFQKDGTLFLVERLHHSVIKAGLRRINNSYSRISLADIAAKLGIKSVSDAEGIVAKAIMDGVVTGLIDAEAQCLISKSIPQRYKTTEPAEVFNKRISFCSSMYTDAVKACI